MKRERGERREEGERGPRASATRKENRNASVTFRSIARTSRGSTTMAISPARLRSDSSIRLRCGDGPCRLRAIPSGRALRCNLRLPAPETRVSIPEPPRASVPIANNIPLDVMAHCPTRARCANPQGVLLSATLRSGLGSQGYGAKAPRRAEKRDRGSALPAVACAPRTTRAPRRARPCGRGDFAARAWATQPSRSETLSAQRTVTVLYTQSIRRAS